MLTGFLLIFATHSLAQETLDKDILKDNITQETFLGDYGEMVNRRIIRVLVTMNKTNYFFEKAAQSGITYEFFNEFEKLANEEIESKHLKMHVVYIPVTRDQLIPALLEGRGDIAAASLTITEDRLALADFTDPLASDINEIIVTHANSPAVETVEDLSGKTIFVRKSSSYYKSLVKLNDTFKNAGKEPVNIELAAEHLEDEDLLEMVNAEQIPMIVVDDYLAEFWSAIFTDIKLHPEIKVRSGSEIALMIRKNSPELKQALNHFVKDHKIGTLFGNIMVKRYLKNTDHVSRAFNTEDSSRFKQAADLLRKYSETFDFDWLMIAALSYQESRIDQSTVSQAGAVGVMQVLPSTAAGDPINITDINGIENNIHAGVKYLRWIFDRYFADDEQVDRLNKMLFTFASYNAGPAKVTRLRKEAEAMGLNPNIWFDNVEVAAAKIIGRETVQYVSNIYKYYFAYSITSEQRQAKADQNN